MKKQKPQCEDTGAFCLLGWVVGCIYGAENHDRLSDVFIEWCEVLLCVKLW